MYDVPFDGAFLKSGQRATKSFGKNLEVVGFEPRTPSLAHICLPTRVHSSALIADGRRCINSTLVNVLNKGQGGAILPMEDTNLQELKKIENETNRE